jgi:hypothetical protein
VGLAYGYDVNKERKIMKKLLNIIFVLLISAVAVHAQLPGNLSRIRAAKITYISDRLNFTEEQHRNFVPVYNQYEREISDTRQSFMGKYRNTNPKAADDATSRQYIDDNLDYQESVIEIKRKYNDRFLKIMSPQQLSDLYKAEREFKQMLMQRLKQRMPGPRFIR